jgi:hydroxymethylpyrimidine/phosphomethylpyrimidine kinase
MRKPPVVWTIAGFDPSSGAGITADVKTISSLDCYGVACITALTVQNTAGVRRVDPVAPEIVLETLYALLEDIPPQAIKIGMLATANIAGVVADFLESMHQPACCVILDPILRSSSGAELLDASGARVLLERLLPLATVVTPNRTEAAVLTGLSGEDSEAMARVLRQLGAAAAVVTGGDASGRLADSPADAHVQYAEDVLAYAAGGTEFVETLRGSRIHSSSTHGTGCAFSTAIACALAHGQNVPNAVTSAKAFVRRAIERAPGLGSGKGPMGLEHAGKD